MSRKMSSLQRSVLGMCATIARVGMDSLAVAGAARMWIARRRSYPYQTVAG